MTTLAKAIRSHRETTRNRRAIAEAIANASSPGMRSDLIAAMQRQQDVHVA
ncbi:hypothetical protein [Luteipulveratus flavus]|uniref:Uncharacterized protein n=1 Tax=Luteipulveratus flavus TaxID=3031728 RepID=A0ABT6CCA9_9MICO|nr:hypothetical protein [Luteipulveratus sp. YIM 133296]MDF8265917.1 hypothetical protein [Luteipulveratus sp. YIM 133296]